MSISFNIPILNMPIRTIRDVGINRNNLFYDFDQRDDNSIFRKCYFDYIKSYQKYNNAAIIDYSYSVLSQILDKNYGK